MAQAIDHTVLLISAKKKPRTFSAPVLQLRIIDGDTLKLLLDTGFGGREEPHCRLLGIDAPEKNTEAGRLVMKCVWDWCAIRIDKLEWDSEELDKYGRSLGDLNAGFESLANFLVARSLAKQYNGEGKRSWEADELADVHERAMSHLRTRGYSKP